MTAQVQSLALDIPVLDLASARDASGSFSPEFLAQLEDAASRVGFFQITGFGARPGQIDELFSQLAEFFARPTDEKLLLDNRLNPHFRGYTRIGAELTKGRPDSREQIDYGPEQVPASADELAQQPSLLLKGPNQWPAGQPQLAETAMAWAELMRQVGDELLAALAVVLGQDEDYFVQHFAGDANWMGKLVHYVGGVKSAGDQGVGEHKDYGFLTLLLQDQIGGLQVLPEGATEWIDVPPTEGALVINLGEMLEVATDGFYQATVHRVIAPDEGVDRYSVPYFHSPRLTAVVDPVPLPPQLAAKARGVTQDPDNPLLANYGENVLKGWLRAHPEVTAKYHSHLVED
ncbi:isopenicillin N synthase family dioxygenase [Micrococcoides hystricis]|uniref:Isopenicillin N synthase family dioxygenase n=1 Tax=Micrococcoides hystricis TaxID=1572761 RepID=A0ABV6PAT2_9MICC